MADFLAILSAANLAVTQSMARCVHVVQERQMCSGRARRKRFSKTFHAVTLTGLVSRTGRLVDLGFLKQHLPSKLCWAHASYLLGWFNLH